MTGDNQLIGIVWTGLEVPAAQLYSRDQPVHCVR